MKKPSLAQNVLSILFLFISNSILAAAPTNDLCSVATNLTPKTSCGATAGQTLSQATQTGSPTSTCGANTYDVWYKFTVPSGISTFKISLSVTGTNITGANTFIEAYNASACGAVSATTSLGCASETTGLTLSNLAVGTYYVRVFTTTNPVAVTNWGFSICVLELVPSNDDCANATSLTSGVTNTAGSVWTATASSGIPTGCATGNPDDDVWYKFTATSSTAVVTLSSIGAGLASSGAMIQIFSGTCGTLGSLACGDVIANASGLTSGNTYYVRVYSAGTGALTSPTNSAFSITVTTESQAASQMSEIFNATILSGPSVLNAPWEVTYGPDGYLWVTESKGYKAYRIDPNTGAKTTILDISQGSVTSELTSAEHTTFNVQFSSSQNPWPQGGFAGLALHPKFMDPVSPKNYVYISYVRVYDSASVTTNGGYYFTNNIVRFTYNTGTGKLESPVALCDTLPGSSDHNSQRMIIAPVNGTYYLFYGQGDMGAGQLTSQWRPNHAQDLTSYQGKILRFNLESDGDAGAYDPWIPNDNPYNGAKQSAVWCAGIRNNQGFAYDTTLGILYGSSHGPYSDDEINVIEESKNYGHPLVIGYAADGNYNNSNAGSPNTTSSLAVITDEAAAAAAIPNYKDPLFSAYATDQATIHNIWVNNPSNSGWPSEAWSGMDIYKNTIIPGWKNSLVICGLKWGRVLRLKLGSTGTTIAATNGADTIAYFQGANRYRDLAFNPNGKDMYVAMESATTVGPNGSTTVAPVVPTCTNCIIKYSFLGYADNGGESTIPSYIDVTDTTGSVTINKVDSATTVTIDDTNNNLWVPITGPDGNILAEIYANGNNLGTVKSAFYKHSGAIRIKSGVHYLDRNITITPDNQPNPSKPVKIRLYFNTAEYNALDADPLSGVSSISDVKILTNEDVCSATIASSTTLITPAFSETHGTSGYMLQGSVTSFSSFYFASANITLPLNLLTFKGSLQSNATLLQWQTTNEINTAQFVIERSGDGQNFQPIGTVGATGTGTNNNYSYTDYTVMQQSSSIVYYRLKMVDKDGTFTYSDVVTINLPSITGNVVLYPNPANSQVQVTITAPADGNIKWSLIDNAGRVLMQNSTQLKKGINSLSINVAPLSTGSYYFSVSGAGIDEKVKLERL